MVTTVALNTSEQALLDLLNQKLTSDLTTSGLTVNELAALLNISQRRIRYLLRQLIDSDKVVSGYKNFRYIDGRVGLIPAYNLK